MPVEPRPHLRDLAPYEWETSASEIAAAAGIPEDAVVRFDTNTTPWPPVAWESAVLDLPRLPINEYPHPSNEPLRSALARHLGVEAERVVVTSGADEALYLVASVYLGPGTRAVVADPSFSMFRVVTETVGATLLKVAVDDSWDLPRDKLLGAISQPDVRVVWLCTPNNPTGRAIPRDLVEEALACARHAEVVVDEAYSEIAGRSLAPLLARHDNMVLVRTFSKGYGLAGARVGYLAAAREVTRQIDAVRLPQNITAFGIAAASRALADQPGLERRVAALRAERDRLGRALEERGWLVVTSEANFLLTRPPVDARALSVWLQAGGLVVRSYGGHPRLDGWLRIGVRAPQEDDRLLVRLDDFPGRKPED